MRTWNYTLDGAPPPVPPPRFNVKYFGQWLSTLGNWWEALREQLAVQAEQLSIEHHETAAKVLQLLPSGLSVVTTDRLWNASPQHLANVHTSLQQVTGRWENLATIRRNFGLPVYHKTVWAKRVLLFWELSMGLRFALESKELREHYSHDESAPGRVAHAQTKQLLKPFFPDDESPD